MALAIMKTQKFPSCRSAQDLNADEMKQAAETPIQASGSSNETDSKSGTGTTGPGVTKPEDERELQAKACEGKNKFDSCRWTAGNASHIGVCNESRGDNKLYCTNIPASGIGSGTGGFSPKQAACLNKAVGNPCRYIEDGVTYSGYCIRDIFELTAQPLHCSNASGPRPYSKE